MLLVVCACAGCGGSSGGGSSTRPVDPPANTLSNLQPTSDALLSPGNLNGGDEDPTIARSSNALNVVWFSERNGTQPDGVVDRELFLQRSTDGRTFSTPQQITRAPRFSFAPRITVDAQDQLHLVWWRVIPTPDGCTPGVDCNGGTINRVLYKHSDTAGTFNADQEDLVAEGPGDWLPSIVIDRRNSQPRVYFASPVRNELGAVDLTQSTSRIYVVTFDGTRWSTPVMVQGVNATTSHNTYPQIAQRSDGSFILVWTRYALGNRNFDPNQVINEPTAETWYGESSDGINFTAMRQLSSNAVTDALPMLYQDHSGTWFALWQNATSGVVEAALSGANAFQRVARPEIAGNQPQVLATPTVGVFFGVYVNGAAGVGKEKIHFRYFTK